MKVSWKISEVVVVTGNKVVEIFFSKLVVFSKILALIAQLNQTYYELKVFRIFFLVKVSGRISGVVAASTRGVIHLRGKKVIEMTAKKSV